MANMLEPWTAPKGWVIPGHSAEPLEAKLTFLTYLPKKLRSQPFLPCQRVNLQLQFIKFLVILPFNFQLSLHLERGTHHAY